MNAVDIAFLAVAGIGAGLVGATAGLASLVSYPALLLVGLSPIAANVTNTVALTGTTVGAAAGSRPELRGQGRAVLGLSVLTALGGAAGGALLMVTSASAFAAVVPWLVAGASVVLVVGPRVRALLADRVDGTGAGAVVGIVVFLVGVYGGYFGAAAGVLMLATLSTVWAQSLARTNAAKNIITGAANLVAAVVFSATAPVAWPAAAALGVGSLAGARLGPALVRRVPATALRLSIGACGLVLAIWLGRGTGG